MEMDSVYFHQDRIAQFPRSTWGHEGMFAPRERNYQVPRTEDLREANDDQGRQWTTLPVYARSCPNGAKILQIHRDGLLMTRDGVTDACPNTSSGSSPTDADQSGHAADVELELQSSGTRDLQLGVTGAFSRTLTTAVANITEKG